MGIDSLDSRRATVRREMRRDGIAIRLAFCVEAQPQGRRCDFFLAGGHFTVSGNHAGILLGVLPPIVHTRKEPDKAALRWTLQELAERAGECCWRGTGRRIPAIRFSSSPCRWATNPAAGQPWEEGKRKVGVRHAVAAPR